MLWNWITRRFSRWSSRDATDPMGGAPSLGGEDTRLLLPPRLRAKAYAFPESSYGATTVTLVLRDGRRIAPVVLAGGRDIVRVEGRTIESAADLPFDPREVVNVHPHKPKRR